MSTAGEIKLAFGTVPITPSPGMVSLHSLDGTSLEIKKDDGTVTPITASAKVKIGSFVLSVDTPSIIFSAIAQTYRDLEISGKIRSTNSASADECNITVNSVATGYYEQMLYASGVAPVVTYEWRNQAQWILDVLLPAASDTAGLYAVIKMDIFDYTVAYNTSAMWRVFSPYSTSSGGMYIANFGGFINSNQAISSIKFQPVGGNFLAGSELNLYGVS